MPGLFFVLVAAEQKLSGLFGWFSAQHVARYWLVLVLVLVIVFSNGGGC